MKKVICMLAFLIPFGFSAYLQGGLAKAEQLMQNSQISEKQAKEIALGKVKGTVVSVKLEEDDGRKHYEVIVKGSDGTYEVEIDANTGKVLEVEREGSKDGDDGGHDDDHGHDEDGHDDDDGQDDDRYDD